MSLLMLIKLEKVNVFHEIQGWLLVSFLGGMVGGDFI